MNMRAARQGASAAVGGKILSFKRQLHTIFERALADCAVANAFGCPAVHGQDAYCHHQDYGCAAKLKTHQRHFLKSNANGFIQRGLARISRPACELWKTGKPSCHCADPILYRQCRRSGLPAGTPGCSKVSPLSCIPIRCMTARERRLPIAVNDTTSGRLSMPKPMPSTARPPSVA